MLFGHTLFVRSQINSDQQEQEMSSGSQHDDEYAHTNARQQLLQL